MKNKNKLILASMLLATGLSASNISVKLGMTSISFDNISETAPSISMVSSKSDKGFAYELGYTKGDELAVTKFAGAYNWEITNNIYAGANIGIHGVNYTANNSFNKTSFTGYTFGIQGKYSLSNSHSFDLSYNTGSATDKAGIEDYDLSLTSISYSYRF